ncbi:MAG: hypothetical protein ACRDHY_02465, partial [Anaerolineales bacterium]
PYSIMEGYLGTNVTIPNDGDFHAAFSSPLTPFNSLTLSGPQCCIPNHYQTCWWGHGWLEESMPDSIEGSIRFWLFDNYGTSYFESGWIGHSPDPQISAYQNHTSLVCGIGFFPPETHQYRMEVQSATNGLCPSGPSITAHKGRVQVIVMPAPQEVQYPEPGYDTHTCTDSWAPECSHHCDFNPLLPTVIPAPPRNACNP